uniref:Uncharacterized protein n=1 Tax=Panagrolaimus sp. ES5 TaxID=591445 RepID=A0AC34FR45_9BILA
MGHLAARTSFATSYKMATTSWNMSLRTGFNTIIINNRAYEEWNGRCYISYTLFYDSEMRFEFFSSVRTRMDETIDEHGIRRIFEAPEGYMTRFMEAANNNRFSKCLIFVELHLPIKYFNRPSLIKYFFGYEDKIEISDKLPDDIENDFKFDFLKNGDYSFECLDGTVRAQRIALFLSSATMTKQLSSPFHYPVGTVLYTVAVIKPIIIFLHSYCFKLPDSFTLDYIDQLLSAIEFFEPSRKRAMKKIVEERLSDKFAKEKHDFNSILLWLSFSCKWEDFRQGLTNMILSFIVNEYYFKWQQTFPETARNADNPLYDQLFGEIDVDDVFDNIDYIFNESFLTNVILQ